jgi:hypothetical protein
LPRTTRLWKVEAGGVHLADEPSLAIHPAAYVSRRGIRD